MRNEKKKRPFSDATSVVVQKFEEHRINNSVGSEWNERNSRKKNESWATHVDELLLSKCQQVTSRLLFCYCCCCHDIDRACLHSEWHNVDILTKLVALFFNVSISNSLHTSDTFKCHPTMFLIGIQNVYVVAQFLLPNDIHSACSHSSPISLSLSHARFVWSIFFIFEKVFVKIQIKNWKKIHIAIGTNSYFYLYERFVIACN